MEPEFVCKSDRVDWTSNICGYKESLGKKGFPFESVHLPVVSIVMLLVIRRLMYLQLALIR